jgi:membrane-bound lytic murein transglycosylase B
VRSGVPPEYLAAILGVETYYGRLTGSYRVLDALATLAFDYPPRAKFFRDELEQFLLLTRDLNLDPLAVKGSYAGAMGAPQFMPSNYRRYAVDAMPTGASTCGPTGPTCARASATTSRSTAGTPANPC